MYRSYGGFFSQSLGWTGFTISGSTTFYPFQWDGAQPEGKEAQAGVSGIGAYDFYITNAWQGFTFTSTILTNATGVGDIFGLGDAKWAFSVTHESGVAASVVNGVFSYVTVPLFDLFTVSLGGSGGGASYSGLNGRRWYDAYDILLQPGTLPDGVIVYGSWGVEGLDTFISLDGDTTDIASFYQSLQLGVGYHLGDLWPRAQLSLKDEFVQAAVKVTAIEDLPFDVAFKYSWLKDDASDDDPLKSFFSTTIDVDFASGDFSLGGKVYFRIAEHQAKGGRFNPNAYQSFDFYASLRPSYVFDADKGYSVGANLSVESLAEKPKIYGNEVIDGFYTKIGTTVTLTIPVGPVAFVPGFELSFLINNNQNPTYARDKFGFYFGIPLTISVTL